MIDWTAFSIIGLTKVLSKAAAAVCLPAENVIVLLLSTLFAIVQVLRKVHKWAAMITLAASLTCAALPPAVNTLKQPV